MISSIPSRDSNPFATCWTRPGAIPYIYPPGESASRLVARLGEAGWWGEIIGPHGSGKSTLLASLLPELAAAARQVVLVQLHDSQRSLPAEVLRAAVASPAALLVVDGYEQLGWPARRAARRACRRGGGGLLVTAHETTRLPTIARVLPNEETVQQIVAQLTKSAETRPSPQTVQQSFVQHGGNVRETLFDLYDHHERQRRQQSHW